MRMTLGLVLLSTGLLSGCGDFWRGFQEKQALWQAYMASPAYHQRTYTSTYRDGRGGSAQCHTTCDRYDCATKCYGP